MFLNALQTSDQMINNRSLETPFSWLGDAFNLRESAKRIKVKEFVTKIKNNTFKHSNKNFEPNLQFDPAI